MEFASENSEMIVTRVRPDIRDEIERVRRAKGLTIAALARTAIHEYLNRNKESA